MALQEAHEAGVVHRDVKPANVMLVRQGDDPDHVKVVDFGLVKHIDEDSMSGDTGSMLGSPQYMAPEQVQAQTIDHRADIYALGMVLYRMLTGRVAFEGETLPQLMYAHVHVPVPPFSALEGIQKIPPQLEKVVMKCLQKDPAERFESAADLATALHRMARKMGGTVALRSAQGAPAPPAVPTELDMQPPTIETAAFMVPKTWVYTGLAVAFGIGFAAVFLAIWG